MSIRIDNSDNLQLALDISQQDLKKQSDMAKRFVNPAIREHPQLDNIKGALQILKPQQLISVLEKTRSALNGEGGTVDIARQDMPRLAEPVNNDSTMNSASRMLALLGKISQLTSDSSLQSQLARLKLFNSSMSGAENTYTELAQTLESQGEQWAKDSDALKEAKAESGKLEKEVKSAESELKSAQSSLAKLEAEAEGQDPVSPELSQKIDQAKVAVANAQAAVDKTTQDLNQHTARVLNPAVAAESASRTALDGTLAKSQAITSSTPVQQQIAIENQRKQNDNNSKSLTFLMALISQLIDESASNELKAAADLKTKLSEAAAKDSEKKAQEYEDNVRKSEEMQKVMGCIGKVLGWVITTVSFAAALFTGGASLAFAAIGLALTVGDEINQAVNGKSFMSEAMKPIMEAIIQPMMELLGKVFEQILESLGIDKSTAQMMGQIMGAIAAAMIMVAAVVVAGSVASKLSSTVAKKIGTDVMDKIVNNVIGDTIKRMGQGIGRSMGMQEAKIAKVATRTEMATSAVSVGNTAVQTAGDIVAADLRVDAAKAKAQLMNNMALQDLLNEMLERAVESFKNRIETTNAIVRNISSVAENQMQAGKFITRKMGAIAG